MTAVVLEAVCTGVHTLGSWPELRDPDTENPVFTQAASVLQEACRPGTVSEAGSQQRLRPECAMVSGVVVGPTLPHEPPLVWGGSVDVCKLV